MSHTKCDFGCNLACARQPTNCSSRQMPECCLGKFVCVCVKVGRPTHGRNPFCNLFKPFEKQKNEISAGGSRAVEMRCPLEASCGTRPLLNKLQVVKALEIIGSRRFVLYFTSSSLAVGCFKLQALISSGFTGSMGKQRDSRFVVQGFYATGSLYFTSLVENSCAALHWLQVWLI